MLSKLISNRNFLKLWLAQIFSQVALNALIFVLTIKIYQETFSSTSVSLLILAFGFPAVLFGYLAGVYVDKLGLKKVLISTNLIRVLLMFTLFWSLKVPIFIYPIAFFISLATQFFVPAEGAAIPALVDNRQLINANSLFTLTLNSSLIIGFVGAGPLIKILGMNGALFFLMLLFALALILVSTLPKTLIDPQIHNKNTLKIFFEGLIFIWKKKEVRHALFFLTLTQVLTMVLSTVAPGFVNKDLGLEVEEISTTLMAPAATGMILGALFLGRWGHKIGQRRMVDAGIIGAGICLIILSFLVKNVLGGFAQFFTVVILLMLGFENALITIPSTTVMQVQTSEEMRGRVYGVLSTLVFGAAMVPVLLAGGIADLFGGTKVVLISGIFVLLIGLYRLRGYLQRFV